jgi:ABC-type branched-subunit amino acid transport system substrate-binding protein
VTGFSRRTLLALAGAVVLAIVAGTMATVISVRGDAACPDARYGCATFEPGEPIVIGALFPTVEGPGVRGVREAVDLRGGRLLGRRLEVLAFGTGCTPDGGAQGARELATDAPDEPPVVGVVGGTCVPAATPAAQILSDSGVTLASPAGTDIPPTAGSPRYYLRFVEGGANAPARVAELVLDAVERLAVAGHDGEVLVPRTPVRDVLVAEGLLRL